MFQSFQSFLAYDLAAFRLTRADDPAMFMSVTGFLPMGSHYEDKDQECHPAPSIARTSRRPATNGVRRTAIARGFRRSLEEGRTDHGRCGSA